MTDWTYGVVLEVHERVAGRLHLRREHLVRTRPPEGLRRLLRELETAGPLVLALGDGAPRGAGLDHPLLLHHLLPAPCGDLQLGHSLDLAQRRFERLS